MLQRGASNVYFPHVMSSIYIPLWAEGVPAEIAMVLDDAKWWQVLTQGLDNGKVSMDRCNIVAELVTVDPAALREAAQRKLEGKTSVNGDASTVTRKASAVRNTRPSAMARSAQTPTSTWSLRS